ncbi:MAG: hypothetical protein AB7E36_15995 [Salinivirgaceae bacterium]
MLTEVPTDAHRIYFYAHRFKFDAHSFKLFTAGFYLNHALKFPKAA